MSSWNENSLLCANLVHAQTNPPATFSVHGVSVWSVTHALSIYIEYTFVVFNMQIKRHATSQCDHLFVEVPKQAIEEIFQQCVERMIVGVLI